MKIALIGTGILGVGVGLTLLRKGYELRCYNRTEANAAELVEAGAAFCTTPREAAEGASHVIILVWDQAALEAVLQGENGLYAAAQTGQVVIDMSTQLPATAREEGRLFAEKGALFVDAPVHGSKAEAHAGGLWIMAGGSATAYAAALPALEAIGASVHPMGAVGAGCIAKLCGNHLVSAILAALAESLAMAEKSGLDSRELIKLWGQSDFRSPIIEGAGHSMIDHQFGVSFHLRTMVKDTELIRNYSESIGVPVMISGLVHELFKISQNRGWGEQNATAIFQLFEEMAGIKKSDA